MNRFKNLENGIILDTETGLEWQAETIGPMPWQEAMDCAKQLKLGGHSDWRLPTIKELITLIDFSLNGPASSFPGMEPLLYWSSSSYACYLYLAWDVYFDNGLVSFYAKDGAEHARCARGGK